MYVSFQGRRGRSRGFPPLRSISTNTPFASAAPRFRIKKPWRESQAQYTCHFCCEPRPRSQFSTETEIPSNCQSHLSEAESRCCISCLKESLRAQLDLKHFLKIGCPGCGVAWGAELVRKLMDPTDRDKLDKLELISKEPEYTQEELPDGLTTELLLRKGARSCPWCKWPFVKEGGCEDMQCGKCAQSFNIHYALALVDAEGKVASPVVSEWGGLDD